LAVDSDAAPLVSEVDEDRRLATDTDALRFEECHGETSCYAGVDGVAALFEHAQADCGSEIVAGRDHAMRALEDWPCCEGHGAGFADGGAVGVSVGRKNGFRGVAHYREDIGYWFA